MHKFTLLKIDYIYVMVAKKTYSFGYKPFVFKPFDLDAKLKAGFARIDGALNWRKGLGRKLSFGQTSSVEQRRPARWLERTARVKADDLSVGAQKIIERLFLDTVAQPQGSRSEHLGMAIELADGSVEVVLKSVSSGGKDEVGLPSNTRDLAIKALTRAGKRARANEKLQKGPIKVYAIHTHPQQDEMFVELEQDGRYYTALSGKDYVMAEIPFYYNLMRRIRAAGFYGPIEIVHGAVPVPAERTSGSINKNLYVTTYVQEIDRMSTGIERAA